jgi:hypothetical protein
MRAWAIFLLLAATAPVPAQGCGFRRRQPLACSCARIECPMCALRLGGALDDVRVGEEMRERRRWPDVVLCRLEVTLEARFDLRFEGRARLEPGTLFAAVGSELRLRGKTLEAELVPAAEGREAYLRERLFPRDVGLMLLLWRSPGRLDVRLFPLSLGKPATVTVHGYLLAAAPVPEKVRLYRTGERFLAVAALARDPHRETAAFRDEEGGRALHFLAAAECRERYATDLAEEVPFVDALESAATGRGTHAATAERVLLNPVVPPSEDPRQIFEPGPPPVYEPPPPAPGTGRGRSR